MTKSQRYGPLLEKDIQRQICDWLFLRRFFFWRSNNIPVFSTSGSGGKRFRSLPKYTPRGLPDIIVIHKGIFYALEVKRPHALLRPEQSEFGMMVTLNGGRYEKVESLEQAMLVFNEGPLVRPALKGNPNLRESSPHPL